MVSIYYSENDIEWTASFYIRLLEKLPLKEQVRINKYVRWQDRQAGTHLETLLIQCLAEINSASSLEDVIFNSYNKPYFLNGPFY